MSKIDYIKIINGFYYWRIFLKKIIWSMILLLIIYFLIPNQKENIAETNKENKPFYSKSVNLKQNIVFNKKNNNEKNNLNNVDFNKKYIIERLEYYHILDLIYKELIIPKYEKLIKNNKSIKNIENTLNFEYEIINNNNSQNLPFLNKNQMVYHMSPVYNDSCLNNYYYYKNNTIYEKIKYNFSYVDLYEQYLPLKINILNFKNKMDFNNHKEFCKKLYIKKEKHKYKKIMNNLDYLENLIENNYLKEEFIHYYDEMENVMLSFENLTNLKLKEQKQEIIKIKLNLQKSNEKAISIINILTEIYYEDPNMFYNLNYDEKESSFIIGSNDYGYYNGYFFVIENIEVKKIYNKIKNRYVTNILNDIKIKKESFINNI
jgi:hypothetical protein